MFQLPDSLYLIFTIPGIQGLYISSSLVPRISISNNLIFTIPGIQGLYISSSLVPRISESNIYDESLYILFLPSFTIPMYWFLLQPAAKDRSRSPIRPKAMPVGPAPSSSGTPVPEPVPHPKAPPEATPPAARAPLFLNQHIIFYHKCWVFLFCCFVFCTSRALMLASCLHTCPPSSIFFFPLRNSQRCGTAHTATMCSWALASTLLFDVSIPFCDTVSVAFLSNVLYVGLCMHVYLCWCCCCCHCFYCCCCYDFC